MPKKRALICGISGQDGAYLAQFLLGKDYEVIGTSRDADVTSFENLSSLAIRERVALLSMSLTDFKSVLQVLGEVRPDEIYNLSGQSSVALSFQQPAETLESIALGTVTLLEAIRSVGGRAALYNSASSECFGEVSAAAPATEKTPFHPRSPYGVAKAAAFWQVANYREAYGLYACSGILFNHESNLRPPRFVTRKIVRAACRISAGSDERLKLGRLQVVRDWGYAPEYVVAMWLMLQQPEPLDFVVATGESHVLSEFVSAAFEEVGLDWETYVEIDPPLTRAADIFQSHADPSLAARRLGWQAATTFRALVTRLIAEERQRTPSPEPPPLENAPGGCLQS